MKSTNECIDFNDENSNKTDNTTFDSLLTTRMSRRNVLRTGAILTAAMAIGRTGIALSSASVLGNLPLQTNINQPEYLKYLGFKVVPKSLDDKILIPDGYSYRIIYALGDPLNTNTPEYKNDGTDTDFEHRAGDHHDGMEWFGLSTEGQPSNSATNRGILGINHEATTNEQLASFFIHEFGGSSSLPRPATEVDKELALHGVSFVEVQRTHQGWETVRSSPFNRRLTPHTPISISGVARGSDLLKTRYSPTGKETRGTLNNCGTGATPWGTLLTGEENWYGYFTRNSTDDAARDDKSVLALQRYGRKQGEASRHGWESAGSEDQYSRWNNSLKGTSKDGSDDYRHEMNTFGYIVEIDPYDGTKKAKKRTSLGRFAHESAAYSIPKARQPLHFYMGDDARNEYIYKWVSQELWHPADAHTLDRMAVGDKYLDKGTLYVAKFDEFGRGLWIELSMRNPKIKAYEKYQFTDQADIAVHARLAADAVGATKMDRPEWNGVHPHTGEVYFTLTNNSNRNINPNKSNELKPDAANPRAYQDDKQGKSQQGNPNGHILRLREDSERGKLSFTWDVYLFGAESLADGENVNLSQLTEDQDFSSPDGIAFSKKTGLCWIQTDDSAYTDASNCMMLAAIPGQVGDGSRLTMHHTNAQGEAFSVTTFVGKAPEASLKRFLVGPKDCEITGFCETPDGKTLFVNIQHPGENTKAENINQSSKYSSQWPSNAGYGQGVRPRSATIVITKNDGGLIGS
jgi:secreted PhoX family phosphatase